MFSVDRGNGSKLGGFDFFVLAGGVVNLLVIAVLVGYWLLH